MKVTEEQFFDELAKFEIRYTKRNFGWNYTFVSFYGDATKNGYLKKKAFMIIKKKWFFFVQEFLFYVGNK